MIDDEDEVDLFKDQLKIQADEIERLREENEKLFSAVSLFQIAMHNALFALEKTVDDIHRKENE